MKQGAGGKVQEISWLLSLLLHVSHNQPEMIARGPRRHHLKAFSISK